MRVQDASVPRLPNRPVWEESKGSRPELSKGGNKVNVLAEPGRESESVLSVEKRIIEAVEKANEVLVAPRTMLKLSLHEGTHEIMVKVLNEETGEVIREIPPEKLLDLIAKIWEMAGIALCWS